MRNLDRIASFVAAALVAAAVIVRLPSLASPPMDFAAMRQHHSALIARARFLNQHPAAAPAWQRDTASDYVAQATIPEPQIIERLDALLYGLMGTERLDLARWLSLALWCAGALCVSAAARQLSGGAGGLLALAVCLFLPYTIGASSSIQSDTLAFTLMSAALFAWTKIGAGLNFSRPRRLREWIPGIHSRSRLGPAPIVFSMAAGFVRAMTLFWLAPVAALVLWRGRRAPVALRLALIAAPAVGYAAYRWASDPLFGVRVGATFAPGLLMAPSFWRGWAGLAWRAFGLLVPVSLVGVLFARGRERTWLVALWCGYAAYGLIFDLHISTHPYYQTLAVPMVALSLASMARRVVRDSSRPLQIIAPALVAAALLLAWCWRAGALGPAAHADDIRMFEAIGQRVDHSRRVIILGDDWGVPLRYYGGMSGRYWPAAFEIEMYRPLGANGISIESAASRLKQLSDEVGGAEYFVVTDAKELSRQTDLQALLARQPVLDRTSQFTIFDLRSTPTGAGR